MQRVTIAGWNCRPAAALKRLLIAAAVLLAIAPAPIAAQDDLPEPTSTAAENALQLIDWSEAVVTNGLRIAVGERASPASDIPLFVQNVGDTILTDLSLRVVWNDDEGHKMVDASAAVYPIILRPGEVGITGTNADIASFPTEGGTFHYYPRTEPTLNAGNLLDLPVQGGLDTLGRFSGTVTNPKTSDLDKVWVYWACVEKSGIPTEFSFAALDVRVLRGGATEEFDVKLDDTCQDGIFMTGVGKRRE
jgi:hypothetical protein